MNERAGFRPKPHTRLLSSALRYRRSKVVHTCLGSTVVVTTRGVRLVGPALFSVQDLLRSDWSPWHGALNQPARGGGRRKWKHQRYLWVRACVRVEERQREKDGESAEALQLQNSSYSQFSGGARLHSPPQVSEIRGSPRTRAGFGRAFVVCV